MKPLVTWQRHTIIGLVSLLLLGPSALWALAAWRNSPLDTQGLIFVALAVAWWSLVIPLGRPDPRALDPAAWPIVALGALVAALGLTLDIRLLQALGALGMIWGLAWALLGGALALVLAPSILFGAFGLPTTTYLLGRLLLVLGQPAALALPLKVGLTGVALVAGVILLVNHVRGWSPRLPLRTTAIGTLMLVALAALGVALSPPRLGPPARIDETRWAFGTWVGAEVGTSPNERTMFQDCRLSKRVYARRDGRQVSLLIVESGDVHRIHSPEYCLGGSGWQVSARSLLTWTLGPQGAAGERLAARRGDQTLTGVYWYSSPSRSTLDLPGLRLQSRLVRGESFALYLATVYDAAPGEQDAVLRDFLSAAPWQP
jgi:hypothetical protein